MTDPRRYQEEYLKQQRIQALEAKVELQENLPHLHGWKWYKWARAFFESTNHQNFLCAANQISKSSTQIRKCIHWATDRSLWPKLWRSRPLQFWYLYPSKDVATVEFEKKWKPSFLPKGKFKDDPVYGWKEEWSNKKIFAIHFFSGVSVYFKTYGQDVSDLQTGTVDAIFCDEELPEELYSELSMRIAATDGYFHMVFTATLGQEFWRCVIEERGKDEVFPGAFKLQVSMYECLEYDDGSRSPWTRERIQRQENACKSQAEIDRRIWGKFVLEGGLKYPSFDRKRNIGEPRAIPSDWLIYEGVDIGSGGLENHPAAISFIAVRPDFKFGRVFRGWRGDGIETTAGDVYLKSQELERGLSITRKFYDHASVDFKMISERDGGGYEPAEKKHDVGEDVINVLFKNGMLVIDDIPELKPLTRELVSLKKSTPKNKAKDDFVDSMRYGVTKIPWDWSAIRSEKLAHAPVQNRVMSDLERARRGDTYSAQSVDEQMSLFIDCDEELDAANDLMEI